MVNTRVEVSLLGDSYTEQEALTMKAEMVAYALSKGLHGNVTIVQPL